jgi:hypothetical protein
MNITNRERKKINSMEIKQIYLILTFTIKRFSSSLANIEIVVCHSIFGMTIEEHLENIIEMIKVFYTTRSIENCFIPTKR